MFIYRRVLRGAGAEVVAERVTFLGEVAVRVLNASNSLFTAPVQVQRTQTGCVRFCYVPAGSSTPRRHRCQPDTAAEQGLVPIGQLEARLVPSFISQDFGHFGDAYLSHDAPDELLTGADDGAEMGVFGIVERPQRLMNLTAALGEFLPFELNATPLPVRPGASRES